MKQSRLLEMWAPASLPLGAVALLAVGTASSCGSNEENISSDGQFVRDSTTEPEHSGKVMICHIPPGNPSNAHTIVVGAPAEKAHLAHGDYLGPCKPAGCNAAAEGDPAVNQMDEDPHHGKGNKHGSDDGQAFHSETRFSDQSHPGKVMICHIPPGNPSNAHTIVVGAPAEKAHLAHGDYLGFCAEPVQPECVGDANPTPTSPNPTSPDGGSSCPTESGSCCSCCPAGIDGCTSSGDCASGLSCFSGCCLVINLI